MCDRVCNQKNRENLEILIAYSDKNTKAKIRAAVYFILYAGNALYIVYKQIINKVISIVQWLVLSRRFEPLYGLI